jgi:hypothetical protein
VWKIELVPKVNRAFSAGGFLHFTDPGALPEAGGECCAFGAKNFEESYRHFPCRHKSARYNGST